MPDLTYEESVERVQKYVSEKSTVFYDYRIPMNKKHSCNYQIEMLTFIKWVARRIRTCNHIGIIRPGGFCKEDEVLYREDLLILKQITKIYRSIGKKPDHRRLVGDVKKDSGYPTCPGCSGNEIEDNKRHELKLGEK